MNVRNLVLLKMVAFCVVAISTILGLQYLFGDWGMIIYWSVLIAYLLYIMFQMLVDTESRKRQDLVDKLKQ
ncbi:MAG: hypothetical protein EB127_23145 [Alphaproteobacteria bacterium]|nr:hypothetical protein [Alphaproteobacteria bacterium]